MSKPGESQSPPVMARPSRWSLKRGRIPWLTAVPLLFVVGIWLTRLILAGGTVHSPEPFDVEAFRTFTIPAETNAFPLYEEASKALGPANNTLFAKRAPKWSEESKELQAWAVKHRPALDLWLRATSLPDLQATLPGSIQIDQQFLINTEMRSWAPYAALEASRLVEEGKHAEAWPLLRGRIRMTLHITKQGAFTERFYSGFNLSMFVADALAWAENPEVGEAPLRQALVDAEALVSLLPSNAHTLKMEYMYVLSELKETNKLQSIAEQLAMNPAPAPNSNTPQFASSAGPFGRMQQFMLGEPERSRAAARLAFANWLPQADRPEAERDPIVSSDPLVFSSKNANAVLSANSKANYFTILRGAFAGPNALSKLDDWPTRFRAERKACANLVIGLAARLYELQNGTFPDDPKQLVGTILKALPEGAEDPDLADPVSQDNPSPAP